ADGELIGSNIASIRIVKWAEPIGNCQGISLAGAVTEIDDVGDHARPKTCGAEQGNVAEGTRARAIRRHHRGVSVGENGSSRGRIRRVGEGAAMIADEQTVV